MPTDVAESLPAQLAGAVSSEIAELERDAKEAVRRRTVSSLLDVDQPTHPAAPKVQSSKPLLWRVELWDQDHSIPIHNLDLGLFGELAMLPGAATFQAFSVPVLLLLAFVLLPARFFAEALVGT
jgi:sensor domain CHASE-containing protein